MRPPCSYVKLAEGVSVSDAHACLTAQYAQERFVHVLPEVQTARAPPPRALPLPPPVPQLVAGARTWTTTWTMKTQSTSS